MIQRTEDRETWSLRVTNNALADSALAAVSSDGPELVPIHRYSSLPVACTAQLSSESCNTLELGAECLALLPCNCLTEVPNTLTVVRLWLTCILDLGCQLTDLLLVNAFDRDDLTFH